MKKIKGFINQTPITIITYPVQPTFKKEVNVRQQYKLSILLNETDPEPEEYSRLEIFEVDDIYLTYADVSTYGIPLFAGSVLQVIPPIFTTGNEPLIYQLNAVGNNELVNHRVLNEVYQNTTTEDIIRDIHTKILQYEGITLKEIAIDTVAVSRMVFDDVMVDKAFDELANFSNAMWNINAKRELTFISVNSAKPAPFNIDNITAAVNNLQKKLDASQYRNRQIVKGGTALTDELIETKNIIDIGSRNVYLDYPVSEVRKIVLIRDGLRTELTVSSDEAGLDTDFTYNSNSNTIHNENIDLVVNDKLEVTYIGFFSIKTRYDNTSEIALKKQMFGGTGIVESITYNETIQDISVAADYTKIKVDKFGEMTETLTFNIDNRYWDNLNINLIRDLDVGQLISVDLPRQRISNTYLILGLDYKLILNDGNDNDYYTVEVSTIKASNYRTQLYNNYVYNRTNFSGLLVRENETIVQLHIVEDKLRIEEEILFIQAEARFVGTGEYCMSNQTTTITNRGM